MNKQLESKIKFTISQLNFKMYFKNKKFKMKKLNNQTYLRKR